MAPHSSTVAWKIPWMEEPGRLQSMGSLRVGHDWVTSLSLSTFMHWKRNGNTLQCSCLENPMDGEAWWAADHGVAQSRTRLKRLSSSSSSSSSRVHCTSLLPPWLNLIPKYFILFVTTVNGIVSLIAKKKSDRVLNNNHRYADDTTLMAETKEN